MNSQTDDCVRLFLRILIGSWDAKDARMNIKNHKKSYIRIDPRSLSAPSCLSLLPERLILWALCEGVAGYVTRISGSSVIRKKRKKSEFPSFYAMWVCFEISTFLWLATKPWITISTMWGMLINNDMEDTVDGVIGDRKLKESPTFNATFSSSTLFTRREWRCPKE